MNTTAGATNKAGQNMVEDILIAPGKIFEYDTWIRNGQNTTVINVVAPNVLGLRFDAYSGKLQMFIKS